MGPEYLCLCNGDLLGLTLEESPGQIWYKLWAKLNVLLGVCL